VFTTTHGTDAIAASYGRCLRAVRVARDPRTVRRVDSHARAVRACPGYLRDEGTGGGAAGPFAPTRQKLGGGVSSPCGQFHCAASASISQTAVTDLWYHY
jgi:hypothetical protein